MAKFKLNQELNNVKKETMVSDFKSKKVFFSIPSTILNLIDSSNLPSPLEVALKKIEKNTRRLKLIPVSLGNKNEDYPDFFCDLPIRLVKKIKVSGKNNPRRPRRPPTGKVIEEIQQPLGFVNKINDFMKKLIQKMGTKKTLAAFVVALVAILIIRYTWNAKKKEDETTGPLLIKGGFKKSQRFERERVPLNQYPLNQYPLRNSLPKRIANLFITKLFNVIEFLFNLIGFLSVTYILLASCIILLNLLTFLFIKFLERLEIILGIPNTPNDNPIHTFQELQEILKKIL